MNTFVIVGQVEEIDQPVPKEGNERQCSLIIRTRRPFRTNGGENGEDVFRVQVWRGIADEVGEIVQPGMWVACRGRLQAEHIRNTYLVLPIAEHISFPDGA